MRLLKEQRKIILILSDGFPDSTFLAEKALHALLAHNFEVYGIGIQTTAMQRLLPESNTCAVYDLQGLAPAMFDMLRTTLLKKQY